MDIKRIIGATEKNNEMPFRMSVDDIDSHKLTKVLGYLDTHKTSSVKNVDPQQLGEDICLCSKITLLVYIVRRLRISLLNFEFWTTEV